MDLSFVLKGDSLDDLYNKLGCCIQKEIFSQLLFLRVSNFEIKCVARVKSFPKFIEMINFTHSITSYGINDTARYIMSNPNHVNINYSKSFYEKINHTTDNTLRSTIQKFYNLSLNDLSKIDRYLEFFEAPRTVKPDAYWYYGGINAFEEACKQFTNDTYIKMNDNWNGYDKHKTVIIRNFKYTEVPFLISSTPYTVETRYGKRQLLCDTICFVANTAPEAVNAWRSNDKYMIINSLKQIKKVQDSYNQ